VPSAEVIGPFGRLDDHDVAVRDLPAKARRMQRVVSRSRYERHTRRATTGCAPAGSRPRDLRSSFITVQVHVGVPLTTIAKQCGTGVAMIEDYHAGMIENWDGRQVAADVEISTARKTGGRSLDVLANKRTR
jgi:hypothetical protein